MSTADRTDANKRAEKRFS